MTAHPVWMQGIVGASLFKQMQIHILKNGGSVAYSQILTNLGIQRLN